MCQNHSFIAAINRHCKYHQKPSQRFLFIPKGKLNKARETLETQGATDTLRTAKVLGWPKDYKGFQKNPKVSIQKNPKNSNSKDSKRIQRNFEELKELKRIHRSSKEIHRSTRITQKS